MAGDDQNLREAFARQLDEFNQRFDQRPGWHKLFFGPNHSVQSGVRQDVRAGSGRVRARIETMEGSSTHVDDEKS
jgi:hypothetical protein